MTYYREICKLKWSFCCQVNLHRLFQQYGVVETSRYERYNGYDYSIIQFKDAASATTLIMKGHIVLFDVDFIVKPFHSLDKLLESILHMDIMQSSQSAVVGNPEKNILEILNDDCLDEIFRWINSLSDIIAIENVCKRFKRIAKKSFIPLLKRKRIDFTELKAGGNVVTLMNIQRFLQRYGSAIVSVLLCESHFRNVLDVVNPILKLMQAYCPNLQSLTLYKDANFKELEARTVGLIRSLLSKLSHVEIWNRAMTRLIPMHNYVEFISACSDVETLVVNIFNKFDVILPETNFPKLKVFKADCRSAKLDGFFAKNRQIEKLNFACKSNVLRSISENMPELRELSLRQLPAKFSEIDTVQLERTSLSVWKIDVNISVRYFFEMPSITSLQFEIFNVVDIDLLLELAIRLKNLKNLEFFYIGSSRGQILSKDMIKDVLQHATKLAKLKIKWPSNDTDGFQSSDYNEWLQVVQNRIDPLKLDIILDSVTDKCNGEHGIKTIYQDMDPQWLTIAKRYLYLTRKADRAHEVFERQAHFYDFKRTHVLISSLPKFDIIPLEYDKMEYNVI